MTRRKIPGQWVTRGDGSKAWRLPYRPTPGATLTSKVFADKDAAERFYLDRLVDARDGTSSAVEGGRQRFVDFGREWGATMDWAPATREQFEGAVMNGLERFFGGKRLEQIDQLELKRLRSELIAKYATSTAAIRLHYATAIMRAAYQTGRVRRDVTVGVRPPVRRDDAADGKVGPNDVPTRDEVVAVIAAAPEQFRAAIVLGACGLRVGEVLGTTVEALDVERRVLVVDRQLVRHESAYVFKKPKREKVRTIELPSWAVLELRRHLRDHGPFWELHRDHGGGRLLFRGGRDAPLRREAFYVSAWRPALVGAGLARDAYVFHSLRHWCASTLLAGGAWAPAVAGHLGDVPETVMRTYAHWLRDDRSLAATILDRMLAPTTTAATGRA